MTLIAGQSVSGLEEVLDSALKPGALVAAVLDPVRTPPEGIGHFGEVKASAVLVLEDRVIHLEGDRYLHLNRPPVA